MERRFLAVTMVIMVMVATTVQALPPALKCSAKCGLLCVRTRFPPLVALCFSLCLVQCLKSPPPKVYECTRGCAKRQVADAMVSFQSETPLLSEIDKKTVEHYVESCYEKCNKEEH